MLNCVYAGLGPSRGDLRPIYHQTPDAQNLIKDRLMRLSTRRTLVQALIVSVLIHAALLLGVAVPPPASEGTTAAAINVVMKREEPRITPVLLASERVNKTPASPVKPSIASRRKMPEQTIIVANQAADSPTLPVPASSSVQDAVASPVSSPTEAVSGLVSKPTIAASEGISANDVSDLRVSVITATRRFKNYPDLAKERGWEGTVDVVLVYHAHSPYPDVSVAHSSGRTILDDQALEMVGRAARTTNLPTGLRGRDFRISLPVKFSLEDE